jgi:activating signal cointegrator complex subunit 1
VVLTSRIITVFASCLQPYSLISSFKYRFPISKEALLHPNGRCVKLPVSFSAVFPRSFAVLFICSGFSSLSCGVRCLRPSIMSEQKKTDGNSRGKEKKPPLTHFLCFPLVNATSLPQLEASLAGFKAAIPPLPRRDNDPPLKPAPPLIPDAAVRPVGTLHLTLGVMSLPTKERLDEAVHLLQSLDLNSMVREAESCTSQARPITPVPTLVDLDTSYSKPALNLEAVADLTLPSEPPAREPPVCGDPPEPFSISLESLHPLPRARSATVLYVSPVDSTSRLYRFGVMLRDKFLEAGFLEGEYKKVRDSDQKDEEISDKKNDDGQCQQENGQGESTSRVETTAIQQLHLEEVPRAIAEDPKPEHSRPRLRCRTLKPRPLLLHATVVNTIYVRGHRRKNGSKNGRYTFDARKILSYFRDYYLDESRTIPRSTTLSQGEGQTSSVPSESDNGSGREENSPPPLRANEEEGGASQKMQEAKTLSETNSPVLPDRKKQKQRTGKERNEQPFIWARNVLLDRLCICEMGAKEVDQGRDNARLGAEYTVVAERRLDFGRSRPDAASAGQMHVSSDEDGNSIDGGVTVGVSV